MTVLFSDGFESGKWTHQCRKFPVGGEAHDYETGNIFVPEGWTFWFLHESGTWDQPEAHHCWKHVDPRRIHSGDGAYMAFSFYRHHDAGLMRQVQAEPGSKIRLTAFAHAWSNHKLEGHESCGDDGRCSCGVGRDIVAIPAEDIPDANGDPWNDALGNSIFVVGIDPDGGEDPFSLDVEWGPAYAIYNGYATDPLEAEAIVGAGGTATVFLRHITLYGFKHNDGYWDDAKVEIVANPTPPLPPTERGQPRVQYDRTYALLPPGAGREWALAVIDATWDSKRYTLGGSADDAGIGDLDVRHVLVINPDQWLGDIGAFFEKHYPGVEVQAMTAETPEILRQKLGGDSAPDDIALCQRDPRWENKDLGEDPGGETIGEAGCLLTSLAMCLRHAGVPMLPDSLNDALADNGIPFTSDDMLTGWAAAVGMFDVFDDSAKVNREHSATTLGGMLEDGWEIVLRMPGSIHFVYLEKVDGGVLHIIDPWDGKRKTRNSSSYAGIRAAHRSAASPPVPPTPTFPLRGVHDLAGADWLLENGLEGWCTVARYIGTDPQQLDLKKYADAGIRIILRLSYSYAQDDGGAGTMPPPDKLAAHEQAVVATMLLNPSAWGFVYGNEPNNKREWPGGFALTPDYYLESYNRVWAAMPAGAWLSPCAIDPYNPGWGDWRQSWYQVLCEIDGADFLALHAYTHGSDPGLIWGKRKFGDDPLVGVYYDMRVLESQQDIIPVRFWGKPNVITETNHWVKDDGSVGWDPDAGEWTEEAFAYYSRHGIAGACLFRHGYSDWNYSGIPGVLGALRNA